MNKHYSFFLFFLFSLVSSAGRSENIYAGCHSCQQGKLFIGGSSVNHCSGYHSYVPADFSTHVSDPGLLKYDISHYGISLEVSDTSTFVKGYTEVLASALETIDEMVLELSSSLVVDSVLLNGIMTGSFTHATDLIRIAPDNSPAKDELFTARVYYHGSGGQSSFYAGISSRIDALWKTRVTYTLSEPFRAKDWFACKQVLTDKADSADISRWMRD